MKRLFTLMLFFAVTVYSFGQSTLKGKITDFQTKEPVAGATIVIEGTSAGTVSDLDGNFTLKTEETGEKKIVIRFMGYTTKEISARLNGEVIDLGEVLVENEAIGLSEVSVIASMAISRKTPVAVSSINSSQIEEKLGNDEFPEILKQTPGVYATKQGGAFGDSRVNVRGFDMRNTAVMINGVPVNDMENGWVYWSNWAGLADVTRSMQVQRGLGAAKIAVPSVGGTINILTNTTDARQGGHLFYTTGNDNMNKYGGMFSSGLSKSHWATTISLARNTGNGYAKGTQYEAYSYFFNLSKKVNSNHTVAFSVFGAPQWHNQRSYQISVANYQKYGTRYNDQWGYRDGQVLNVKKNYYHKPQAVLNHFWNISPNTQVITAVYASVGNGGGTGAATSITDRTNDGLIDFSKIVANNVALGNQGASNILKSSRNDHVWYGLLSSVQHTIGKFTITGGIDGRSYIGKHYQSVYDLLGGQFYIEKITTSGLSSTGNFNDPNRSYNVGDKLSYNNDGVVRWYGAFAQAEYAVDKLTVFAAASLSDKWYQRIDYFRYFSDEVIGKINSDESIKNQYIASIGQANFDRAMNGQKSKIAEIIGYSAKGGANYNISEQSNIYVNSGYFERQPDFNTVFPNNLNDKNKNSKNEKILGFELGYGFKSKYVMANVNVYHTSWRDKTVVTSTTANSITYFANISGVNALHKGVELDMVTKPARNLKISLVASLGDWKWKNNVDSVRIYDENHETVGSPFSLYLKDVHVGNSAQTVLGVGIDYDLMKGFGIGANYTYFDRLYANFVVENRKTNLGDTWKMPAYSLLDMNLKYNFVINGLNSSFYVNVHNLLNTEYFSDGTDTNINAPGAKQNAQVFYGLGTTWSAGIKIRF